MSFLAAAAIGAGIGAAGNLLGSASQSAMGYYMSKHMAKYNYDLQKRGYQEFPTAQVEGLRAAGINPMVAYGGIAGAQAHAGNYQAAPGSDLGSSAVNNYRENKKMDPAIKNIQADTEAKYAQAGAAQAQAGAAADQGKASLINAMTNAKRVNAEISLMQTRDPTESGWGVADKVLSYTGDVGTTVGGTALGAKAVYDIMKNKSPKPELIKTKNLAGNDIVATKYPSGLVVPEKAISKKPSKLSKAVNAVNSAAKASVPLLILGGKAGLATGAAAAAGIAGKKARETIKKDKNSDYNKGHKYRVPNAFGIPTYW